MHDDDMPPRPPKDPEAEAKKVAEEMGLSLDSIRRFAVETISQLALVPEDETVPSLLALDKRGRYLLGAALLGSLSFDTLIRVEHLKEMRDGAAWETSIDCPCRPHVAMRKTQEAVAKAMATMPPFEEGEVS